MTTAIAAIVDATIVTALGLIVWRMLSRKPAAVRHAVLAASLTAAAAAPAFEITLPHWEFAVLSSTSRVTNSDLAFSSEPLGVQPTPAIETPDVTAFPWTRLVFIAWAIGFTTVMAGLFAGFFVLFRLTRRCHPIGSNRWREHARALSMQHSLRRPVEVVESGDRAVLLTWGLFRPRIVVPAGAESWPDERIQVVLTHEFAHIVRRDWALQIGAEMLRAVYWFNPLVWLTCRRLRDESEQACDDVVLRRVEAADYALHLLAVARQVLASGHQWAIAPAVANPSTLERRIAAMLNPSRNRTPVTHGAGAFALLTMLAVAAPLAAVTLTQRADVTAIVPSVGNDIALAAAPASATEVAVPPAAPRLQAIKTPTRPTKAAAAARNAAAAAQQKPASLSGRLLDASGAVLPGVEMTLTDAGSGMRYSKNTDDGGKFEFRDLPPSQYNLVARLAGFASLRVELALAAGENVQRSLTMRVGGLMESVTVTCAPSGASIPPGASGSVLAFDGRGVTKSVLWTPGDRARTAPMAFAAQVTPIRVGGQIRAPKKLKDAPPTCPADVVVVRPGGVVVLESTIGADGKVTDVKVLRSIPLLDQSAIDAVRQWEFTPTLLNGSPVPVIMTVTVTYTVK